MPTIQQTTELLKNSIPGNRIGLETPIYMHSVSVGELLAKYGFVEDVVNAGYLHDIVEDGNHTLDQLKELGYSDYTVHLVDLATFDIAETDPVKSWRGMIQRMITEENTDAWAVKLADITHNISECHNCTLFQRQGYLFIKAPVFIYYGNKYFPENGLYKEFIENYREQVRRYHEYFSE